MARPVRLLAFTNECEKQPRTVEDNLDWTCERLDRAVRDEPDVVCLTETFATRDSGLSHPDSAEELDGAIVARMAGKAREHRLHIVCAFIERLEDGTLRNTAAILDRTGTVLGRYHKIHPTIPELDDSVLAGPVKPKVIETDFGRVGSQICFDANWPEDWAALKKAGAEVIFFPSAFSAGRILEAIATIHHVPIVAACYPGCCRIIDRDGLTLNRQGVYQPWVTATIDLDNPLFHLDAQFQKVEAVREAYGADVTIRVYEEEGWWRIFPERPDLDILQIIETFELERLEDYFARSAAAQAAQRPGAE